MISTLKYVPLAVMVLLLAAFALTLASSTNADQVSFKMFLERFFITGGYRQGIIASCGDGFLVAPPVILLPAAALWAQMTRLGSGWLSYRIVPYSSLAIVLLILINHNLAKNNRSFWPLLLFVTIGTMPFAITWLRPEAIILGSCMILFFIGTRMLMERRILYLYLYGLAGLMVYSVAIFVHPRSIYLVAVPAISVLLSETNPASSAQKNIYRVIFIAGLSALTYAGISFFQKSILTCAQPLVEKLFNSLSTNPMDIVLNPARFISNLRLALVSHAPLRTISQLLYRSGWDADFLPYKLTTTLFDLAADLFIALAIVGLAIYVTVKFLSCILRTKDAAGRKELYLIASVFAALAIPYALATAKRTYEVACFGWTLMIVAVLLWPLVPTVGKNYRRIRIGAFTALAALSTASDVLSYNNFVRPWVDGNRDSGVPYFVDMVALDRSIGEMLAQAHVGPKEPLIVSDLTYEAAKYHPYVLPVNYMAWGYAMPGATEAYLKRLGIHYGVIECDWFKPQKEFPAHLLIRRRITQWRSGHAQETFDVCLLRV
jgi:hypothetical protein